MKTKLMRGAFALLLAVTAVTSLTGCDGLPGSVVGQRPMNAQAASTVSEDGIEQVRLLDVVDGDTLLVQRADGEVAKVRLIGVDTPESVHPDESRNSAEGDAASAHTKELLEGVGTLWLESDVSDTDRYGRLLRYVWVCDPTEARGVVESNVASTRSAWLYGGDGADPERFMLNAILVADGTAVPKAYEPDTAYQELFESLA